MATSVKQKTRGLLLTLLTALMISAPFSSARASIPSSANWEVRPAGSDNNGGFFANGASGTDYSQRDTPIASGTAGAASASSATFTDSSGSFTAAMVGNGIDLQTYGYFEVTGYTNSTTITLDRAPSASAISGVSWAIGGGLANLSTACTNAVAGNNVWVKGSGGPYTTMGAFNTSVTIHGYGTTRRDGGKATIQAAAAASSQGITLNASFIGIENIVLDFNGTATPTGLKIGAFNDDWVRNCVVKNDTGSSNNGIDGNSSNYSLIDGCEVTNWGWIGIKCGVGTTCINSYVHDTTSSGGAAIQGNNGAYIANNIVYNWLGTAADGIFIGLQGCRAVNNSIYLVGRHGILINNAGAGAYQIIRNNIVCKAGQSTTGYGFQCGTANNAPDPAWDYNAFWSNSYGNINDASAAATDGASAYTFVGNISLSGDPFVSASGGNFQLNTTSGAGAACRNAGYPTFPPLSSTTTSYPDMGAIRAAATTTNVTIYRRGIPQ